MSYKVLLKPYNVNCDIFDRILKDFENRVKVVDNIQDYYYGNPDKSHIFINKEKTIMIIREIYFCHETNQNMEGIELWKQVRLMKASDKLTEDIQEDITGTYAYNYMIRVLKKYYTWKEIDACLMSHTAENDDRYKQQHFETWIDDKYIYRFDNCSEYDINSAHGSAIAEIFPKAADEIKKMYTERKNHPINKKFFNYFVGMLGSTKRNHGKYIGTYIWIVQRTTKMLLDRLDKTGGKLIYINTDGFIVQNPDKSFKNSKLLGDFKLEYQGTVWIAKTRNYRIKQIGDNLKGTAPKALRSYIKLSEGQLIDYDNREYAVNNHNFKIITREIVNE